MPTTRILEADHLLLQRLAKQHGKQQQEIIHEALDRYHRDELLDQINAAFANLSADPAAWHAEQQERAAWDAARFDGTAGE